MNYFVYAMYAGDYIKIGITKNIESRVRQVQTGTPMVIDLVRYVGVDNRLSALKKEKEFHNLFKLHNTNGEWFGQAEVIKYRKFIDYFENGELIKRGISHKDRGILILDRMYKILLSKKTINSKIEKLSGLLVEVSKIDSYYFLHKNKKEIKNKLEKHLSIILGFDTVSKYKKSVYNESKKQYIKKNTPPKHKLVSREKIKETINKNPLLEGINVERIINEY